MLYVAVVTPVTISFIDTVPYDLWFIIDLLVDLIFVLDLLINMNTAYYNEEGVLKVGHKDIFLNYAKTWLVLDLLTCVPFDLIQLSSSGTSPNKIARVSKLRALPKLFRITRLLKIAKQAKSSTFSSAFQNFFSISHSTIRLCMIFIATSLCIHVVSCFWYFMAKLENFSESTWVYRLGIINESTIYKYLCSIYWAVTTLTAVGYGDITARTPNELGLCIIWMLFSLYFLSFTVGSITAIVSQLDQKKKRIQNLLVKTDFFVKENGVPKELKIRIETAIKNYAGWHSIELTDKQDLVNLFDNAYKYKIAKAIHNGACFMTDLFSGQSKGFLMRIIPLMDTKEFPANTLIYSIGQSAIEMYVLITGKIHYKYKASAFRMELPFSSFGEYEIFEKVARVYSVKTVIPCLVWILKGNLIQIIYDEFPEVYEEFKRNSRIKHREMLKTLAEVEGFKLSKGKSLHIARKTIKNLHEKLEKDLDYLNEREYSSKHRIEKDVDDLLINLQENTLMLKDFEKILEKKLKNSLESRNLPN